MSFKEFRGKIYDLIGCAIPFVAVIACIRLVGDIFHETRLACADAGPSPHVDAAIMDVLLFGIIVFALGRASKG